MFAWINKFFKTEENKRETPNIKKKEEQVDILPSLSELKLSNAISELNRIGILEIILNSPTLNRVSNKNTISWNVYLRFLEEIDVIDQLKPGQIEEFYSLMSIPNLLPVIHELYKDCGRRTADMIKARDERTKDEINKIVLKLKEYNFKQLIKRANMMQPSIAA